MNSGTIIRTLRERCGLTRQQLATMMGVTYAHIWNWEVGRVCPSTDNFVKFVNSIGYEIVIKPKYRKERDGDETVSRYVDAEWLKELYKPYASFNGKEYSVPIGAILANIDDAPSIDLVRCAECKKVREDGGHANCGGYLYCRKWKTLVDEDCFCSWGERSE